MLYRLLFSLLYLLSLLPLRLLYVVSDGLFLLVFYVVRYRRRLVHRNMSDAFPDRSPAEILRTEKLFYRWLCDYMVETVKMLSMSERQMRRRMTFVGVDAVNRCVDEGQSVALYLGHYCNWEWITSIPLHLSPNAWGGQIYHVLENKAMDRLFLRLRQRWHSTCIPMAETLRRMVAFRQKGQPVVVGYIGDQVPFWNNIHHWCQFLNHDTPVLTGTERLVRRLGHAAFYLHITRPRRGYYVCEFQLITRQPQQLKEFELTDIYFSRLEQDIVAAPQYWLWTHNRWKRTREEFNLRLDPKTGKVSLDSLEKIKQRRREHDGPL